MIKGIKRRGLLKYLFSATSIACFGTALAGQGISAAKRAKAQRKLVTPQQTSGPFYPVYEQSDKDMDLTYFDGRTQRADGLVVSVEGQVTDDLGDAVVGALVDIWQANKWGRYRHPRDPSKAPLDPNFQGWGQVYTDKQGGYRFTTIIPGSYPANRDWIRPPHIHFKVSEATHKPLTTQMYFPQFSKLNAADLILQSFTDEQQAMLIATKLPDEPAVYRFDMVLRKII